MRIEVERRITLFSIQANPVMTVSKGTDELIAENFIVVG